MQDATKEARAGAVDQPVEPAEMLRLLSQRIPESAGALDILLRTPLEVSIRFGSARLPLREVLELREDSIVELDRSADGVVEVVLNGRVIVTGEVVSVEGKYGIRILQVAGDAGLSAISSQSSNVSRDAAGGKK